MKFCKSRILLLLMSIGLSVPAINFAADGAGTPAAGDRSWRERFSDWRVSGNPNGSLVSAVESGDLAGVQQALRLGANPNCVMVNHGSQNSTVSLLSSPTFTTLVTTEPILAHTLRCYPKLEIVNALLAAGADINQNISYYLSHWESDPSGNPDLPGIVTNGPVEQLPNLFAEIAEIKQPVFETLMRQRLTAATANSALLAACRSKHGRIIGRLLDRGASIDWTANQTKLDTMLTDTLKAQHKLVTSVKSDDIYEQADDLVLNKTDCRIKNQDQYSLLDSAVLANNYKAVDVLLLNGFSEQDLRVDSIPNLLAITALKLNAGADGCASVESALDKYGNLLVGERKIAEIGNWYDAVAGTSDQVYLPNLRITSLRRDLDPSLEINEEAILDFAKANLIIKLLQDRDMARSGLAEIAVDGGATGFMTGSVPVRYTAVKSRKILENLRMQLAERDSRAAGLQTVAKPVRTAKADSELGFEMMSMRGGRERYAGGGWDESTDKR